MFSKKKAQKEEKKPTEPRHKRFENLDLFYKLL
jgi:hypothetical protein